MKKLLVFLVIFSSILSFSFMVQPLVQNIEAKPGEEVEVQYVMSNTTKVKEDINLTITGVFINEKKDGWVLDQNYSRSAANWIEYNPNITLLPNEKTTQKFKIKVPFGTAGSYFAAFNFSSNAPVTSGQVAYKMNFLTVVQILVSGQGSKEKITVSSATPTLIKENGELLGINLDLDVKNPSDWVSSVWGRIDVKSDELRKILASIDIPEENGTFVSPKKGKSLNYKINKLLPPGDYKIQMALNYGYHKYYFGKTTYESTFTVPAEIEKNRKSLFLSTDIKELYTKIEKRKSSRGIQVNPKNLTLNILNNDYVEAIVTPKINTDFNPNGSNNNFKRLINPKFVQIRPLRDIRARPYTEKGNSLRIMADYRRADLESLKGEYYGNLELSAKGELKSKTLTKTLIVPIIIDFGDNTYNFDSNATLDASTLLINVENTGNSRVKFDASIFVMNSKTGEKIGDDINLKNLIVYPDCSYTIKQDIKIGDADKIIIKYKYLDGFDSNGNQLYSDKTFEIKIK